MKITSKYLVVLLATFMMCISTFSESAETNPLKPVIVVIRHGKDLDNAITSRDKLPKQWTQMVPDWPKYDMLSSPLILATEDGFKVYPNKDDYHNILILPSPRHRLSELGEKQAIALAETLSGFLYKNNYPLVSRVITKDPNPHEASPNPFDTAYPFIKIGCYPELRVQMVLSEWVQGEDPNRYKGLEKMINENKLLKDGGGSTLIVWDADGLKGPKKDGSREWNKLTTPILKALGGDIIDKYVPPNGPSKGKSIYVFFPHDGPPPYPFKCYLLSTEGAYSINAGYVNKDGNDVLGEAGSAHTL